MGNSPGKKLKLRRVLIVLWAASLLWVYLGNIINFHQHRIWGKQLIPVASTITRTKEKDFPGKVCIEKQNKIQLPVDFNGIIGAMPEPQLVTVYSNKVFTESPSYSQPPHFRVPSLRAPPAV